MTLLFIVCAAYWAAAIREQHGWFHGRQRQAMLLATAVLTIISVVRDEVRRQKMRGDD